MKPNLLPSDIENPPHCGTLILCERYTPLNFAQIAAAIQEVSPASVLGDWDGPLQQGSLGKGDIQMLSLDGVMSMSLLNVSAPAPASSLDFGPYQNVLWDTADQHLKHNAAHVMVLATGEVRSRQDALARARALTVMSAAVMKLVPALGIVSVDSANAMRPDHFDQAIRYLNLPNGLAIPFWVRVCFAAAEPDGSRVIAGTVGLRAFGLKNIEYAPSSTSEASSLMRHAFAIAEYQLGSGVELGDGEALELEGELGGFKIVELPCGTFDVEPVLHLTPVD